MVAGISALNRAARILQRSLPERPAIREEEHSSVSGKTQGIRSEELRLRCNIHAEVFVTQNETNKKSRGTYEVEKDGEFAGDAVRGDSASL